MAPPAHTWLLYGLDEKNVNKQRRKISKLENVGLQKKGQRSLACSRSHASAKTLF